VARQRQRLLEAYLAEVIDLACFQRQERTLAGQEADLLAREREVAAQGERLVEVSAIAQSMTQVLEGLRVGLGQAGFEQRRQLVELLIDRVVVTDGQVEIRYVIPTTPGSTHTRFCHLRTDYFDSVALAVGLPVEARPAALVGAGRDDCGDTATAQLGSDAGIAVALVGHQSRRASARPAPPRTAIGTRPLDRASVQERWQQRRLVALAGGRHDDQRPPATLHPQVQLGAQPTAASPQCLILRADDPLFRSSSAGWWRAPAACWWARTTLPST